MKKHQLLVSGGIVFFLYPSILTFPHLHSYSIIWKKTLLEHRHFCSTVCSISLVLRYDNMHVNCYKQDTE